MSFDADSTEFQRELISQNEEIIKLLKAILMGIEHGQDLENLIDNVEE